MSGNPLRAGQVLASPEFQRILALPRAVMTDEAIATLTARMTAALKREAGTWRLRPVQARALFALAEVGGLFGPMRVGAGKTLTSLLAAHVVDARRPLLLLPASLIEKTKIEMRELDQHWLLPRNVRMLSYQMLGRDGASGELNKFQPDLIIADEVHKLKNRKAAVTRRVSRYMHDRPETKFVAISGSIMKGSIKDFAHILEWCLKDGAPVPRKASEVDEWADALDERLEQEFKRLDPGPLLKFCTKEDFDEADGDDTRAARRGFRRRLIETPGVVATQNEQVDCKLRIRALEYDVNAATMENYTTLRTKWQTPDEWDLSMAAEVWRVSRELSVGMHYTWNPRPPPEWRMARKDWASYVRDVLSHSRTVDTEYQVRRQVMNGERTDEGVHILATWQEQEPTFKVNSVPVWHDDSALKVCETWMRKGPGIVWTDHAYFARELAKRTGARYFGEQGVDQKGEPIEKARPEDGAIIASVAANGTGRNLQAWRRGLVTAPPTGPDTWEQLLGRMHRDGQTSALVEFDVLLGCREHFQSWMNALSGAQATLETTGLSQKLLTADIVGFPDPDEIDDRSCARWGNVSREKSPV